MLRTMAVALLMTATTLAAADAPHLTGRIDTTPAEGLLRADLCLARLPMQTNSFLLHRGLNIREVRDAASGKPLAFEPMYDAPGTAEATRYAITGKVGEAGFCVSYVGAFPVVHVDAGERMEDDWKGQIAFDGRATEQTRFYPVAVDAASGAAADKVTYTLDVTCNGCTAIYVNGAPPAKGPKARLTSKTPRQLLLYAGAFPFASRRGVHFVGAPVTDADAEAIRAGVRAIADAEAAYLGVPYTDEPAYLSFAATSRRRTLGKTSWQFVTWPTVAMDGRVPFATLLRERDGRRRYEPGIFMAHEMAHYYFGTRFVPRGPLRWFLLESAAQWLALKAERSLNGAAAYEAALRSHVQDALDGSRIIPLDAVAAEEEIGQTYRYRFGPLLLIALERIAGEEVVRKALVGLVVAPPAAAETYADFRARLLAAGATEAALAKFEADCLHAPVAESCVAKLAPSS